MDFRERLGRFFLLLGIALIALYLMSDLTHRPEFNYLFGGVLLALLGWSLIRRYHQPPEPPQRFERLKRWREKRRARQAGAEEAEGKKE